MNRRRPEARSSRWVAAAGLALLLSLAGCNPGPKYAKTPATTPAAFKEAPPDLYKEGEGWKLAQPGDDKLRGNWWEIYNDPQLSGLEEKVKISNQTILQAEANYRVAKALVVSARSALYPTIGSSPAYSLSQSSTTLNGSVVSTGTTGTTGTGTTGTGTTGTGSTGASSTARRTVNFFSLPFDVSYTPDFWHRIRNTIAADAYSAQASAADVATALLTTQAQLATDYFEIRSLDAQRQILHDTVGSYRAALDLTETLYKLGIDSEQDVAQARVQLDTATAQERDLGVNRATYEHAIAVLIGVPPSNFSLPLAPFNPNPPEVPVAVPSALLERRPDIAAAERTVASANATIGVARAAYYPTLTLSGSGGVESTSFIKWFQWPSLFWSLGPQLSQTLYDGGARRAQNEQAEAQYEADVANYRQTVLAAFQAVEDNLSTLRILADEVKEQHTAVQSSSRYLELAITRYKAGVDSYLNVITAQTSLLTNRETEVSIQLRQMTASVLLNEALGGGWDPASLPQMKDLLARPPAWKPAGAAPASGPVAPPNPPSLGPPPKANPPALAVPAGSPPGAR